MTYEEVEKILGKPGNILRGIPSLSVDTDLEEKLVRAGLPHEELVDRRRVSSLEDPILLSQSQIVLWIYPDSADTIQRFYLHFTSGTDTLRVIDKYLVNDKEVTEEEFDRIGDSMVTHDPWSGYKTIASNKSIRYKNRMIANSNKYLQTENASLILQHCVLFESASGRVTSSGMYPIRWLTLSDT